MIHFQVWSSITQTLCYLLTLPSNYTSKNHPFYVIILISSARDEFWTLTSGCTEICCAVEYLFPPLRQRGQTLAGQRIKIYILSLILLFIVHQIPPDICFCASTCRNLSDHHLSVPLIEFWAFTINCKLTLVSCSRWHQIRLCSAEKTFFSVTPTDAIPCVLTGWCVLRIQQLLWCSLYVLHTVGTADCYASEIGQDYWSDVSVVHQTMNKSFRACFKKKKKGIFWAELYLIYSVFE